MDERLQLMSIFRTSIALERFSIKEQHATKTTGPNPNQQKVKITKQTRAEGTHNPAQKGK